MTDMNKNVEPVSNEAQTGEKKNKSNKSVILALLLIALLGTWGYIIWDKNNTKELISQKDNTISATSTQRDELQKELEDATIRYDIIKTSNTKKDSLIDVKDREIQNKRKKINSLLAKANASQAELAEVKSLIESLNTDIEGYKTQIALLEGQKEELTKANQNLSTQRDNIQKDFDSSMEELKNRDKTINIGSTLHASNFSIVAIDEKGNGKLKETTNAKKVDKLRISFDLDENMITPSGAKNLYIIITDPTGKVITSQESDKFNTQDNGFLDYTQQMEINYTKNQSQTVSFDWKSGGKFTIGDYKIEVYNNGFKIGQGIRQLKKGGLFG
jgi:DNA repair exonuclease SbcCD ATPase subunit